MMKNKKEYLSPESGAFLISGSVMLAGSTSTSGFDDGGTLPGWDGASGTTTSSFLDGGILPDYD